MSAEPQTSPPKQCSNVQENSGCFFQSLHLGMESCDSTLHRKYAVAQSSVTEWQLAVDPPQTELPTCESQSVIHLQLKKYFPWLNASVIQSIMLLT